MDTHETANNYYAFISYNEADRRWAQWLHHKLEYYRLPATLRKETPDTPKRLRPIFWYKKDLSGTVLADALRRELDASRYLIVVCSPASARSVWVNDEVTRFIESGRADHIIPFIVAGTPHSADPADECLPPALRNLSRDKEIRGIAVAGQGREHALVDIVATMLGIRFDTLWQRHKRRRRHIRIAAACVCAFALLVAGLIWDYKRERVEYYSDMVNIYGVPQGITRLTDEQVAHRSASYRFTYRRTPIGEKGFYTWRLSDVASVNSAGSVRQITNNDIYTEPDLHFDYADGRLCSVTGKDNTGLTVMTYTILDDYDGNEACLVDLGGTENQQAGAYLKNLTNSNNYITTSTKIKRYHLTRDDLGRVVRRTYHFSNDDDLAASAIADENNVFGIAYEYADNGQLTRMTYLGYDGKPTTDRHGVAGRLYKPHSLGTQMTATYLDIHGKPTFGKENYATERMSYDEWGNSVSIDYLDPEGSYCYSNQNYSRRTIEYDRHGNVIIDRSFTPDMQPAINSEGFAVARYTYNSKGYASKVSLFDGNGKPCANSDGVSAAQYEYDSRGNCTLLKYLGVDGKPVTGTDTGVAYIEYQYDADGYITRVSAFDTEHNPATTNFGIASEKYTRDRYHRLTAIEYFDIDGKPTLREEGYHRLKLTYDSRGNRSLEECFDTDGKPINNSDGFATQKLKFDNYGNCIEYSYIGADGQPAYIKGYATVRCQYLPNGLQKSARFYDENDSLTLNDTWYAIANYTYDNAGHCIRSEWRDTDSNLCYVKDRLCAAIERKYDSRGNLIEETNLDTDNRPTYDKEYECISRYAYDDKRNRTDERSYAPDGTPVMNSYGYHHYKIDYTPSGKDSRHRAYGIDEKPIKAKNGVSVFVYEYNNRNQEIKRLFFDTDGKPCRKNDNWSYGESYVYDDHGRIIEIARLGKDGRPTDDLYKGPDMPTAIERYTRDDRGNITRVEYLDADSTLSRRKGEAVWEVDYDELSRPIEHRTFDASCRPIGGINHYAVLRTRIYTPDSIANEWLNTDGTFAMRMVDVKKRGHLVRRHCTDSLGNPVVHQHTLINEIPFATCEYILDDRYNCVEWRYYDADGKYMDTPTSHARETCTYDKLGRKTQTEYWDAAGKRRNNFMNFSKRIRKYDERGNISETCWFDENDRPAKTEWGYYKFETTYDARGNIASQRYYMPDGSVSDKNPSEVPTISSTDTGNSTLPEDLWIVFSLEVNGAGQMWDEGYRGVYVVLEYGGFRTGEHTLEQFAEYFNATKGREKHLLLWRVDPANPTGGEVFEQTFDNRPLNARVYDLNCTDDRMQRLAMAKRAEWRAKHPSK